MASPSDPWFVLNLSATAHAAATRLLPPPALDHWREATLAMLLTVTEVMHCIKRHLGLDQEDSDLALLALVADVLTTLRSLDTAVMQYRAAQLPELRRYSLRLGFRDQLVLEFGAREWRDRASHLEALLVEAMQHVRTNMLLYSENTMLRHMFHGWLTAADNTKLMLSALLNEASSSSTAAV